MHLDLLRYLTLLVVVRALWLIAAPSHTPPKLRSEDYGQYSWRARRLFQSLQHDYHTRHLRCHTCRPKARPGDPDLENTDRGVVRMGRGGVRLGEPPRRSSPPAPAAERAGCASDPESRPHTAAAGSCADLDLGSRRKRYRPAVPWDYGRATDW